MTSLGSSEVDSVWKGSLTPSNMLVVGILAVLAAVILFDRFYAPQVPLNVDPAAYAVISHELLQGERLYTDVWDHKPPAIFVAYAAAEIAFGYSPETLIYLNIILAIGTMIGLYFAGASFARNRWAGVIAAVLWTVVSGSYKFEARDPNTEPFMNLLMAWGFFLLVRRSDDVIEKRDLVIAGVLFFLASTFKPVIIAPVAAIMFGHFLFAGENARKKAILDTAIVTLIGAAGWVALFGYFALTDRLYEFYDSVVLYNRHYSGDMLANLVAPYYGIPRQLAKPAIPLTIASVAALASIFYVRQRRYAMLVLYILSAWIAVALPGNFPVHYFQLFLPPLAIAGGAIIGHLLLSGDNRIRAAGAAAAVIAVAALSMVQVPQYRAVKNKQWVPAIAHLNSVDKAAAKITDLLEKDETFFLFGMTANLHLHTGRRAPTPVFFDWHLDDSPVSERLRRRVELDLAKEQPELLITETRAGEVPEFISDRYETTPIAHIDEFWFFARKGGRLSKAADVSRPER